MGYLNPTAVKMTAKSYGSGPYSCGGLLRYSDLSIPAVTKINPTSFDSRTLGRCDGGGFYPSTSTSVDLTFFTTFTNTDFSSNRTIGALEVQCGTGTGYIQYKAIWVR